MAVDVAAGAEVADGEGADAEGADGEGAAGVDAGGAGVSLRVGGVGSLVEHAAVAAVVALASRSEPLRKRVRSSARGLGLTSERLAMGMSRLASMRWKRISRIRDCTRLHKGAAIESIRNVRARS